MDARELLHAARDYRKTVELSQGTVAERLAVEMSTVSRWETAKAHPSLENFLAYLGVLGLEIVIQPRLTDEQKVLGDWRCL